MDVCCSHDGHRHLCSLQHDGINMLPCGGGRFHLIEQVQTVMLVRMIKEEGVRVFILDVVHKGEMTPFGLWASPPIEDCVFRYCDLGSCGIIEVDLLVIIDCHVAGFDNLDSTEKRVADKGWDDVDTARRFLQIGVQLVIMVAAAVAPLGR
jgi:hypothetical protein